MQFLLLPSILLFLLAFVLSTFLRRPVCSNRLRLLYNKSTEAINGDISRQQYKFKRETEKKKPHKDYIFMIWSLDGWLSMQCLGVCSVQCKIIITYKRVISSHPKTVKCLLLCVISHKYVSLCSGIWRHNARVLIRNLYIEIRDTLWNNKKTNAIEEMR